MTPWIDKLITYLSDPLHSEDPEPYSKQYSAGGTEITHHNLEQNLTNGKIAKNNQHVAHTMNPPTLTTPTSTTLAKHTINKMKKKRTDKNRFAILSHKL
jgi:hypothetical protein